MNDHRRSKRDWRRKGKNDNEEVFSSTPTWGSAERSFEALLKRQGSVPLRFMVMVLRLMAVAVPAGAYGLTVALVLLVVRFFTVLWVSTVLGSSAEGTTQSSEKAVPP